MALSDHLIFSGFRALCCHPKSGELFEVRGLLMTPLDPSLDGIERQREYARVHDDILDLIQSSDILAVEVSAVPSMAATEDPVAMAELDRMSFEPVSFDV